VLEERDGTTHKPTTTYILGDDVIGQVGTSGTTLR